MQRSTIIHQWTTDTLGRETDDTRKKKIHYQLSDHTGSSAFELDEHGDIISYEEYFPFGGSAFIAGENLRDVRLKEYRYSGKERDDTTGFYYYGYRYYAPWLSRWLTPDPLGPGDGLNVYRFVQNNPVVLSDVFGLQSTNRVISIPEQYNRQLTGEQRESILSGEQILVPSSEPGSDDFEIISREEADIRGIEIRHAGIEYQEGSRESIPLPVTDNISSITMTNTGRGSQESAEGTIPLGGFNTTPGPGKPGSSGGQGLGNNLAGLDSLGGSGDPLSGIDPYTGNVTGENDGTGSPGRGGGTGAGSNDQGNGNGESASTGSGAGSSAGFGDSGTDNGDQTSGTTAEPPTVQGGSQSGSANAVSNPVVQEQNHGLGIYRPYDDNEFLNTVAGMGQGVLVYQGSKVIHTTENHPVKDAQNLHDLVITVNAVDGIPQNPVDIPAYFVQGFVLQKQT